MKIGTGNKPLLYNSRYNLIMNVPITFQVIIICKSKYIDSVKGRYNIFAVHFDVKKD